MARVTGPLMSMDASGKFGGALVFSKWKGRNTVRQLVIPANPQTSTQQDSRNYIRVLGAGQKFANACTDMRSGETMTDKERLTFLAPSGQAWNGFLVKSAIGVNDSNIDAAYAAWTALSGGEKTAWDTAADGLSPPILDVPQVDAFGVAGTPVSSGKAFFVYEYGLFIAGARDDIPGATPTVYS